MAKDKLDLSEIKSIFPKRKLDSHKGENGRILIIGGSVEYFGAPILSGYGALFSGCDLVTLYVPECNFDVTRNGNPDFIVKKYKGEYFNKKAAKKIIDFAKTCDCILIGPGISDKKAVIRGVKYFLKNVNAPIVLDSFAIYALKEFKNSRLPQPIVITPHKTEYEKFSGEKFDLKKMSSLAKRLHINILLKGKDDYITTENGEIFKNTTGDAGMTVGGSGDVLAGFIASLISQKVTLKNACKIAVYIFGIVGENLFKQKHYGYTASDLASNIPFVIKSLIK